MAAFLAADGLAPVGSVSVEFKVTSIVTAQIRLVRKNVITDAGFGDVKPTGVSSPAQISVFGVLCKPQNTT